MAKQEEFVKGLAELATKDRKEFAELVVEWVKPGRIAEDIVGLMLETRRYKPGDLLVAKIRRGVDQVRTLVPGQQTMAVELAVDERVNWKWDTAYIHVTANEWELQSGQLGTVQEIRNDMRAALRDFYAGRVFNALASIWNAANTPNNYLNVGGPLTATALKQAIDRINETTGGVRGVFGTRRALAPVTEFGNFVTDGTNAWGVEQNVREVMDTGWIGRWYGARIVAFQQTYKDLAYYNALIPDNYVLVIGENVGKFALFGDPVWDEWVEKQYLPPKWNLRVAQQYGMIVDWAQGIFVLEVTP